MFEQLKNHLILLLQTLESCLGMISPNQRSGVFDILSIGMFPCLIHFCHVVANRFPAPPSVEEKEGKTEKSELGEPALNRKKPKASEEPNHKQADAPPFQPKKTADEKKRTPNKRTQKNKQKKKPKTDAGHFKDTLKGDHAAVTFSVMRTAFRHLMTLRVIMDEMKDLDDSRTDRNVITEAKDALYGSDLERVASKSEEKIAAEMKDSIAFANDRFPEFRGQKPALTHDLTPLESIDNAVSVQRVYDLVDANCSVTMKTAFIEYVLAELNRQRKNKRKLEKHKGDSKEAENDTDTDREGDGEKKTKKRKSNKSKKPVESKESEKPTKAKESKESGKAKKNNVAKPPADKGKATAELQPITGNEIIDLMQSQLGQDDINRQTSVADVVSPPNVTPALSPSIVTPAQTTKHKRLHKKQDAGSVERSSITIKDAPYTCLFTKTDKKGTRAEQDDAKAEKKDISIISCRFTGIRPKSESFPSIVINNEGPWDLNGSIIAFDFNGQRETSTNALRRLFGFIADTALIDVLDEGRTLESAAYADDISNEAKERFFRLYPDTKQYFKPDEDECETQGTQARESGPIFTSRIEIGANAKTLTHRLTANNNDGAYELFAVQFTMEC
jgi:hypothetical protein